MFMKIVIKNDFFSIFVVYIVFRVTLCYNFTQIKCVRLILGRRMKNKEKISGICKFSRVTASLLMFFIVAAECNAVVFEPEWTEFCPPRYCDSNENAFSKDATYWYKRRNQFNKSLARCSEYKGAELESCYSQIREAEARKNKVWDVRQEEKYRTTEYNREYYMEKMKYDGINQMLETIKK